MGSGTAYRQLMTGHIMRRAQILGYTCWVMVIFIAIACNQGAPQAPDFDLIIEDGSVYDGTGQPPQEVDIGIRGDRVTALGDLSEHSAHRRVSAQNRAVVPGFIDMHSHATGGTATSSGLYRHPMAENYIRQGVTTVVAGQDGSSAYPIGTFLDTLDTRPLSINLALFVGHGSVRRQVMGNANRAPTPDELDRMRTLVGQAMQEGAFGLSTGLKYPPGTYSKTDEVIELARVAGQHEGIHISHMREEGLDLLPSVEETIRIGEEGHLPTQITHHKAIGKTMWGQSVETLRMVDEARTRGVDVSIDQYPYTASSTNLTILFPAWSLAGTRDELLARLQDGDTRARIKEKIIFNLEKDRGGGDPNNVVVAYCRWDSTLNGLGLGDILEKQGRPVTLEQAAELAMELQEKGGFQGVFHAMDEGDVVRIMQHPMTMIASDGGVPTFGSGVPHPRNYGTFARVLGRYVREQQILSLTEAIRKMTSLPADRIGLQDRGRIQEGSVADLAVLDPATIIDHATFAEPHQYATGVDYVVVAGKLVLDEGKMTENRPGRTLRKGEQLPYKASLN